MAMTKLTLSADKELVKQAKRWAASRNTSLSAAVSRFLAELVRTDEPRRERLAPLTRRAATLIKTTNTRPYKELLTEALMDKYGIHK